SRPTSCSRWLTTSSTSSPPVQWPHAPGWPRASHPNSSPRAPSRLWGTARPTARRRGGRQRAARRRSVAGRRASRLVLLFTVSFGVTGLLLEPRDRHAGPAAVDVDAELVHHR